MPVTHENQQLPKKIAIVIPKYGLVGGGERFAGELTAHLARSGNFELHVFANKWVPNSDRITFHKVPIIRFPRFLRPLSFAWFAQRLIDRAECDIVHSHDRIFRADVFSVHFVPHGGWVRDVRKKRQSLFDRAMTAIESRMMASGASSWFLPVSSIAMEKFRQEYAALPGNWRIVPPGVDIQQFSSPDRDRCRAEIRKRHGIGDSDLLVLFIGMNFEVKGLDTIIAALAKARAAQPAAGIHLLVVGRGNEAKYRDISRAHGIADAVHFAGTQSEGIERYYRAADFFAMLSTFDTFGMVVLEAMAAGLPVIISQNVGARDLVEEGVNGFVIADGNDVGEAAEKMISLLDLDRRKSMGIAAAQTAVQHDWSRLSENMTEIYESKISSQAVTE